MTAEPPRTTWHVAQYRPLALASQRDASASPPANENAALRGASLAFTKSSPAPKPRINTYSGTDGALAAATKAGGGSQAQLETGVASSSNKALLIGSNNNRGSAGPGNGPLLAAQQSVVRERARDMTDPIPSQGTGKVGHVASASSIAAMAAVASSVRNSSPSDVQNRQKPEPLRPRQITGHMLATDRNTGTEGFDLNPEQSSQGNNSARPTSRSPARNQQPDQTSIAPTASLIGLFEGDGDPRRATQDLGDRPIVSNSPAPVIKSPKPMRPIPRNAPENAALAAARRLATPEGAVVKRSLSKADGTPDTDKGRILNNRGPDTAAPNLAQVSDRLALEAARRSSPPKSPPTSLKEPPQPPPARKKRPPKPEGGNIKAEAAGKAASPPRQPSPYRPAVNGRPAPRDSLVQRSSEDSNIETRTLARDSLDSTRSRPHSMSQFPSNSSLWLEDRPAGFNEGHRWPQPHHRGKIYPHMTGDSLADAIVASSLASSRAPSPSKSPAPPLPLPRRHGKGHQWFHQQQEDPRTPSPAKGMRQTMRKPKAEEDDDSATGPKARRNLIKKHPHKHHEGDRKRWRDQVTERERKRYEGVWAANKGAFTTQPLTPPAPSKPQRPVEPSLLVCNILVRDVWSRSRLGPDVLEEVWELVDRTATGCLDREEFVVGLWLIDQRLKGRKLPIKVSSSVWDSVRSMGGIKVHGRR